MYRMLAAIDLSSFTTALADVGTAVTGALGATVTAGLAIAGVIMTPAPVTPMVPSSQVSPLSLASVVAR